MSKNLPDALTVQKIADLAAQAQGCLTEVTLKAPDNMIGVPPAIPALIRTGEKPEIIALSDLFDKYRTRPARCEGVAQATTLDSFIRMTIRAKNDNSVIFGATAWPNPKLTAVIDYNGPNGEARFGKHRIDYSFPLTDECKVWISHKGKEMDQAAFAAFLENHAAELAQARPDEATRFEDLFKAKFATPSDLIDLSRHLEVYVGTTVKRSERLASGERQIEFKSENETTRNGEKIDVPGLFMVAIPAFIDGAPIRIPARLRYRVTGGEIVWAYDLYRWEFWLREQVQADLLIAASETGLPAFEGAPEI